MQVTDPNFFYTYYVGHSPGIEQKYFWTRDMIHHYMDCGMENYLPQIYEACAEDEMLGPKNIPSNLWKNDNLLKPGTFYLHSELTLRNHMPRYDIQSDEVYVYPAYREMKEFYSVDDILAYADRMLKRNSMIRSDYQDRAAISKLFYRYHKFVQKDIQPLDIILSLIKYHEGEWIDLIALHEGEENVIYSLMQYQAKLKAMDIYKVVWRGSLGSA